jgi:hypothetical protein
LFGYLVCNNEKLAKEEIERYQSIHCGLCRTLTENFGQLYKAGLNYDMTFLLLFLSSLYQPEEEEQDFRCPKHPLKKKKIVINCFTDYAGDMTVALSYHKCMDDWQEEQVSMPRQFVERLDENYQIVKTKHQRQCAAVEARIRELERIKQSPLALAEEAMDCFGRLIAELFVVKEDSWSENLRYFGYDLGRFMYLLDATVNYERDKKAGKYNPLNAMGRTPDTMDEMLATTIGDVTVALKKLPIEQDAHLLRNIIYDGMWQKYDDRNF